MLVSTPATDIEREVMLNSSNKQFVSRVTNKAIIFEDKAPMDATEISLQIGNLFLWQEFPADTDSNVRHSLVCIFKN